MAAKKKKKREPGTEIRERSPESGMLEPKPRKLPGEDDPKLSENELFSVSRNPGSKPICHKKRAEDALKEGFPAPQVVDMTGSNQTLAQIQDEDLRERCRGFLTVLLQGGKHRDAMFQYDFNWNHWVNLRHKYRGLHELWLACRDLGDEYRRIIRLDAAHERAVEGVEDPIYSPSGKYLGSRRLYSDRLLELMIKADHPEKFRDRTQVDVVGTVVQIGVGFDRDELKAEVEEAEKQAEDVEVVEPEGE